jgi:Fe-S-cluster-containing dehydrogenase component/CRP-like cAMP-binding protein
MACLAGQRRNRSIQVVQPGVVYEVTRNLLDMLLRSEEGRQVLLPIYRARAARECLKGSQLFRQYCTTEYERDHLTEYFTPHSSLVPDPRKSRQGNAVLLNFQPGQRIISEGDVIDGFYILRLGHVQFSRQAEGREVILDIYGGPGKVEHFGEIALLWQNLPVETQRKAPRPDGRRTATAVALDHVEVLWISQQAFTDFVNAVGITSSVGRALSRHCEELLNKNENRSPLAAPRPPACPDAPQGTLRPFDRVSATHQSEYVRLGLYQGQKLLVLDLDRCTRCDECTRACADSHGRRDRAVGQQNTSRLFREGPRFDRFLVAASCRSCHKPYCLDGCPVDAIHRHGPGLEVNIYSHCIGCGLCERNCPYGAIQMADAKPDSPWQSLLGFLSKKTPSHRTAAVPQKAVNCDLCQGLITPGSEPFCVRACPHDAAFRYSGEELLEQVLMEGST